MVTNKYSGDYGRENLLASERNCSHGQRSSFVTAVPVTEAAIAASDNYLAWELE